MKVSLARTCHSKLTSTWKQLRLKFSYLTPQADIKREVSKRLHAQLLKDSSMVLWARVETVVKSNLPSELLSKLLKFVTLLLEKTHSKFLSMLFQMEVPEKTQPESVPVVSSEDKQSTSHHWEELIKPSISLPEDAEIQLWEQLRASVKFLLKKSWLLLRDLVQELTPSPSERRTKSKESPRVTDELSFKLTNKYFLLTSLYYIYYLYYLRYLILL